MNEIKANLVTYSHTKIEVQMFSYIILYKIIEQH